MAKKDLLMRFSCEEKAILSFMGLGEKVARFTGLEGDEVLAFIVRAVTDKLVKYHQNLQKKIELED